MNSTNLIGRLTKDLNLRYTGSGKAVVNYTLAVDIPFSQDNTAFINCVAWDKTAELMANYLGKGSQIGISGHIQTRSYENNQGQTVFVTEVVTNSVKFLDNKKDSQGNKGHSKQNKKPSEPENPFDNPDFDPFESNEDVEDISDDDLPF